MYFNEDIESSKVDDIKVKEKWPAISTAKCLKRFIEAIRGRIKIKGCFKNGRSFNLSIFGLIKHIHLNPI